MIYIYILVGITIISYFVNIGIYKDSCCGIYKLFCAGTFIKSIHHLIVCKSVFRFKKKTLICVQTTQRNIYLLLYLVVYLAWDDIII